MNCEIGSFTTRNPKHHTKSIGKALKCRTMDVHVLTLPETSPRSKKSTAHVPAGMTYLYTKHDASIIAFWPPATTRAQRTHRKAPCAESAVAPRLKASWTTHCLLRPSVASSTYRRACYPAHKRGPFTGYHAQLIFPLQDLSEDRGQFSD